MKDVSSDARSAGKGIIGWFIDNPVAANLLMVLILVAGLLSGWTIKKKMFPDFDINTVSIQVSYPGAGPVDVEQGVVLKLEEAVRDVTGIKKTVSMAREGIATLNLEVANGFDIDSIYDDVKVAVDGLNSLPDETEKPVISKVEPEKPVVFVTVFGDTDRLSLQREAQRLHEFLLQLPEVNKARIMGEQEREIAVEVSEMQLQAYNLTFSQVADLLRQSSVDVTGGAIRTEEGDISVKARGQVYQGVDLGALVIKTQEDGSRLLLKDIAAVRDGFSEDDAIVRFNGKPAVSIQVLSAGKQSDIATADAVKTFLYDYRSNMPASMNVSVWGDTSYYLQGRLDMMLENMAYGAMLVFLILSLFLRLRVAFWVIVGIPVCFMGALFFLPIMPIPVSINMVSLFAFILVLGVVVDDAIIIGESVYSHTSESGHTPQQVLVGVKKVAVPATFGVLTTIAVFFPLLFVTGQGAPFFESIGMVVVLCLIFSLIESKLILPSHLANVRLTSSGHFSSRIGRVQQQFDIRLQSFIRKYYRQLLAKALNNRYISLSLFVGIFIITLGITMSPWFRFVFFPKVPSDFIQVDLKMQTGSSLAIRNQAITRIEQAVMAMDQADRRQGGDGVLHSVFVNTESDTRGSIIAELTKSENRTVSAYEVVKQWRDKVGSQLGVRSLNFSASTHIGGTKPVYFRLSGENYQALEAAAAELETHLKTYQGVYDVENTTDVSGREVVVHVRPQAEALSLTLGQVGQQMRQGIYGEEVQRIQKGREEIRVMLRYPRSDRNNLKDLDKMYIRTPNNDLVPFSEVATLESGSSSSFIRRTNGLRSVAVMAEVDTVILEPDAVISDIEANFLPGLLKHYPSVRTEREGSSREQQQLMQQLMFAGLLALFLIYALLAIPLKSYFQPIIIMVIIPFGFVGAVVGHMIMGISFSLLSAYGLIALAGVLVNDSLILVDRINHLQHNGKNRLFSVLDAGCQRFRAIVLTSFTTFVGLIPITLEKSLQAKVVLPMAVSLGFGILFATVITLFLIPVMYLVLHDVGKGGRELWYWLKKSWHGSSAR